MDGIGLEWFKKYRFSSLFTETEVKPESTNGKLGGVQR